MKPGLNAGMLHCFKRSDGLGRRIVSIAIPLAVVISLSSSQLARPALAQDNSAPAPFELTGLSCLTSSCHGPLKANPFVHAPVIQGDCDTCHLPEHRDIDGRSVPVHRFQTSQPTLEFCGGCHKELLHEKPVVHGPFTDSCTECHDPHSGRMRYFLKAEEGQSLCQTCHGDLTSGMKYIHAPVALNACDSCHAPHVSDFPGLLVRPPGTLCVFCHYEFKKGMDEAVSVHEPMREACYECHDPHGGDSRGFLPTSQEALCRQCHPSHFDQADTVAFPHAGMVQSKECSDCHNPHWAPSTKLLKRPSIDLCLSCHNDTVEAADGRRLAAVGRQVADNPYRHGPIEQGDCTPCHAAHGSNDPRLMKERFPADFYAPYEEAAYELCFGCHNPALIQTDQTTATGFRNGRLNLHYVHVHKEKGRSCRACHHEHASKSPFHIRDSVPFGEWELQVKFEPLDTGGVCYTGCHTERRYDRDNPVSYETGEGGRP